PDPTAPSPSLPEQTASSNLGTDAGIGGEVPSPTPARRVFVTSDKSNGAMSGRSSADGICVAAAQRANLGAGPWVAWLSVPGSNAIDRLVYTGPYDRLDGKRVVADKNGLAQGTLAAAIEITETGAPATGSKLVWTGTSVDGTAATNSCVSWTTDAALSFGVAGSFDQTTDGKWSDNGGLGAFPGWGCQTNARLYCFEQ
ncbi:MAG: Tryptophan synthase alpha chain, partial [Labilithrix sp.]|nr:Tryptophan synthase alpha chain [Labilithrix sp.]